jgi:hypothetical protein
VSRLNQAENIITGGGPMCIDSLVVNDEQRRVPAGHAGLSALARVPLTGNVK